MKRERAESVSLDLRIVTADGPGSKPDSDR